MLYTYGLQVALYQSASPVKGVIFKVIVIGQNRVGGLQHTVRQVIRISCAHCTLYIYTELHKSG